MTGKRYFRGSDRTSRSLPKAETAKGWLRGAARGDIERGRPQGDGP